MLVPVILAGGSGTRLWPLSRELYPKQLLNFGEQYTMLQDTLLRLNKFEKVAAPIVICNNHHRFMVAEQLRTINVKPSAIILEPIGRNTAPAVAIAALKALAENQDAVLLILPADHRIEDIPAFHAALNAARHYAHAGHLITFGIVPHVPETGYGYIQKGEKVSVHAKDHDVFNAAETEIVTIRQFVEKPDYQTAQQYLQSGEYCWNSGMFMFRASTVLEEIQTFAPSILESCGKALREGKSDLDFFRLDKNSFESCPSDSIDYAVMEKTSRGLMIMLQAGWNDLGSWEAFWQVGPKDDQENVLYGDVLVHDVKRSFLSSTERLIAAVGLEDHVIVETGDAVLVSHRNRVQDVKELISKLKLQNRREVISHKTEYRPWGSFETIKFSERFLVKHITVKPGARLSLQKHFHRAEHWTVVRGTAHIAREDEQIVLKEDESMYIPINVKHCLANPGKIPLEIIEVQTGSYLGEDDIVRFEDIYGRHALE